MVVSLSLGGFSTLGFVGSGFLGGRGDSDEFDFPPPKGLFGRSINAEFTDFCPSHPLRNDGESFGRFGASGNGALGRGFVGLLPAHVSALCR